MSSIKDRRVHRQTLSNGDVLSCECGESVSVAGRSDQEVCDLMVSHARKRHGHDVTMRPDDL